MRRQQDAGRHRLTLAQGMLRTMNPASVVDRGYAIVTRGKRIVTGVDGLRVNENLALRFSDGTAKVLVAEIEGRKTDGQEKADL